MTFLTILGTTKILCSFKLVLEGKTGHKTVESLRLEFLEKLSANTSGSWNIGGIGGIVCSSFLLD